MHLQQFPIHSKPSKCPYILLKITRLAIHVPKLKLPVLVLLIIVCGQLLIAHQFHKQQQQSSASSDQWEAAIQLQIPCANKSLISPAQPTTALCATSFNPKQK